MKKFSKYILTSVIVSILNVILYGNLSIDDDESTGELLFIIFFSIIVYNIFILIIPTIIYLISKSMTAFKVSFFVICGFFIITILVYFASIENLIEILN